MIVELFGKKEELNLKNVLGKFFAHPIQKVEYLAYSQSPWPENYYVSNTYHETGTGLTLTNGQNNKLNIVWFMYFSNYSEEDFTGLNLSVSVPAERVCIYEPFATHTTPLWENIIGKEYSVDLAYHSYVMKGYDHFPDGAYSVEVIVLKGSENSLAIFASERDPSRANGKEFSLMPDTIGVLNLPGSVNTREYFNNIFKPIGTTLQWEELALKSVIEKPVIPGKRRKQ